MSTKPNKPIQTKTKIYKVDKKCQNQQTKTHVHRADEENMPRP
jgi:hypothetical protein